MPATDYTSPALWDDLRRQAADEDDGILRIRR